MLRAKPRTEFSSSTQPYASTRASALDTRTSPTNPVCPPSPRFVAMLISLLLRVCVFTIMSCVTTDRSLPEHGIHKRVLQPLRGESSLCRSPRQTHNPLSDPKPPAPRFRKSL